MCQSKALINFKILFEIFVILLVEFKILPSKKISQEILKYLKQYPSVKYPSVFPTLILNMLMMKPSDQTHFAKCRIKRKLFRSKKKLLGVSL